MKFDELLYWNGFGGFREDSLEYVIKVNKKERTPVPWTHIIANEYMGSIITSNGGGNTWFGNSREFKISNWSNDAILDRPSEVLVFNDGELLWGALPNLKDDIEYIIKYGFGYAEILCENKEIVSTTKIFIPHDKIQKLYFVSLENKDAEQKTIQFKFLIDPILGVAREYTKKSLVIKKEETYTRIFNRYNENYNGFDIAIYSNAENDSKGFEFELDELKECASRRNTTKCWRKKEFLYMYRSFKKRRNS